jgi:hypothetical protein
VWIAQQGKVEKHKDIFQEQTAYNPFLLSFSKIKNVCPVPIK